MAQRNDERLLVRLVKDLSGVHGVRAIALGGSRARGTATADSDYDIGLYYDPDDPIDVGALHRVVATIDDAGPAASVTPIGAWGRWIDGGGWLTIAGRRVDLIYRDLRRVDAVIADCRAGRIERDYQPGHPHAFVSAIYMGEVAYCRALWDPAGSLAALKRLTLLIPRRWPRPLWRRFSGRRGSRWRMRVTAAASTTSLMSPDAAFAASPACAKRCSR
jgi:Nucleotidyltransferase domain